MGVCYANHEPPRIPQVITWRDGRSCGEPHAFVRTPAASDHKGAQYIDCGDVPLPYGGRLVDDVLNRTQTADDQWRTFLAMELALRAERDAQRLKSPPA